MYTYKNIIDSIRYDQKTIKEDIQKRAEKNERVMNFYWHTFDLRMRKRYIQKHISLESIRVTKELNK